MKTKATEMNNGPKPTKKKRGIPKKSERQVTREEFWVWYIMSSYLGQVENRLKEVELSGEIWHGKKGIREAIKLCTQSVEWALKEASAHRFQVKEIASLLVNSGDPELDAFVKRTVPGDLLRKAGPTDKEAKDFLRAIREVENEKDGLAYVEDVADKMGIWRAEVMQIYNRLTKQSGKSRGKDDQVVDMATDGKGRQYFVLTDRSRSFD